MASVGVVVRTPRLASQVRGSSDMDALVPLATQVANSVGPFLPYLVAAGRGVTEALDEHGDEAQKLAASLWETLRPKVEARPAARDAVEYAAEQPKDDDAQVALRLQIRRLLSEDAELAAELGRILQAAQQSGGTVNVTASGARSVAIGGSASGGVIITGDQNRVESGPPRADT
jgi:hypothetical protein